MKYKLKQDIDKQNAVVHCETQEQWDAVIEALGCDWKSDEWGDEGCETCIRLVGNRFSDREFYKGKGFTIHSFTDVFEPELYDLTKTGRVPEGVMVEVSDDEDEWVTRELLFITSGAVACNEMYTCINHYCDAWTSNWKYARHPKPEPKTRPMNFEEVCGLISKGARFWIGSSPCACWQVSIEDDLVKIGTFLITEFTHYTLPDDATERKLEVEI